MCRAVSETQEDINAHDALLLLKSMLRINDTITDWQDFDAETLAPMAGVLGISLKALGDAGNMNAPGGVPEADLAVIQRTSWWLDMEDVLGCCVSGA